jgi:hypothetical protein
VYICTYVCRYFSIFSIPEESPRLSCKSFICRDEKVFENPPTNNKGNTIFYALFAQHASTLTWVLSRCSFTTFICTSNYFISKQSLRYLFRSCVGLRIFCRYAFSSRCMYNKKAAVCNYFDPKVRAHCCREKSRTKKCMNGGNDGQEIKDKRQTNEMAAKNVSNSRKQKSVIRLLFHAVKKFSTCYVHK